MSTRMPLDLIFNKSKIRVPVRYEELDVQRCCQLVRGRGDVITRYNLKSGEKFSVGVLDISRRHLNSKAIPKEIFRMDKCVSNAGGKVKVAAGLALDLCRRGSRQDLRKQEDAGRKKEH